MDPRSIGRPGSSGTGGARAWAARRAGTAVRNHPSQHDRPYPPAEAEFLAACEAYRQGRGLRFLRATDYLAVLLALGYRRPEP
jgi:hypothetical protein